MIVVHVPILVLLLLVYKAGTPYISTSTQTCVTLFDIFFLRIVLSTEGPMAVCGLASQPTERYMWQSEAEDHTSL